MSLKFKRHYKLIAMLVLVSAVLILGLGNRPMIAYTIDNSSLQSSVAASQVMDAATAYSSAMALSGDMARPTFPIPTYSEY